MQSKSINYVVKTIANDPAPPSDLKMRLNDISTGSPDIPGWDAPKNIVKAEQHIGAI